MDGHSWAELWLELRREERWRIKVRMMMKIRGNICKQLFNPSLYFANKHSET